MALESLPPTLRRTLLTAWYLFFFWLIFVYAPYRLVRLNAELDWPVWRTDATAALGGVLVAAGLGLILYCTGLFARIGRGTPIPAAPPEKLVVQGPYRRSRHPIYLADVVVWVGIFLLLGHATLLLYALCGALVLEAVVVLWEEPVLRRRYGGDYDRYRERVPRWISLRPSARPEGH